MAEIPPWRDLHTALLGVGVAPVGTQPAVAAPSGGSVVDVEARAALVQVLDVLVAFGLAEPTPAAPKAKPSPAPRRKPQVH